MPRVALGNPFPIFNGRPTVDPTAVTEVSVPDCKSLEHMIRDIAHDDGTAHTGLWPVHSAAAAPSWVECPENPALEAALAERFGCPVGRPVQS